MASIFLSYVHEDVGKAAALAACLDAAGHRVWWDRHIRGGREFSDEIEAALADADKIIVLWSKRSIHSTWVRDEAATGRDDNRLIPVALDKSLPPLGFRQFQTIDLIKWKGSSPPSNLQDVLDAIADGGGARQPSTAASRAKGRFRFPILRPGTVALALLALVAAGAGWWWVGRSETRTPIVAVTAASGSAPSQEVARQLAVRLGNLQSARGDAFQLISGKGKADIVLQVEANDDARALRRDLSIVSGKDHSILWSTSLQQRVGQADALSQQLTLTSKRLLTCGLDALSDDRDRIKPETLKLYLGACSRLEDIYGTGQYDPAVAKPLEQVVTSAPHFAGAWAKLLASESERVAGPEPPPLLVESLRRHIAQAEKLSPNLGEIYTAKAALLPPNDFLGKSRLYEQAIKADPNNPLLYRLRGEQSQRVGRMGDAVEDAGRAIQLDPLSPALLDSYLSALAYAGMVDTAYDQLRKAQAMWPSADNLLFARFRLDLRFGDPKEALAIYRNGSAGTADPRLESFILARIEPTAAHVQRAIDDQRALNARDPRDIVGLSQTLGEFGRKDEAIDLLLHYTGGPAIGWNAEVLFRPAMREVWRDPRSIAAAAHLGFLKYWVTSGRWPDFCSDPTLPYDCRKEAAKYAV